MHEIGRWLASLTFERSYEWSNKTLSGVHVGGDLDSAGFICSSFSSFSSLSITTLYSWKGPYNGS